MRTIVTVCLGLVLAGCAADMQWFPPGGGLYGKTVEARQAADDAKCREFGFEPETEAYGNCRLQLEQIRATERAAARARPRAAPVLEGAEQGGRVYDSSECIGPVIMGRCKGSIIPNKAYHPTCHGAWLNGQCTGPMF